MKKSFQRLLSMAVVVSGLFLSAHLNAMHDKYEFPRLVGQHAVGTKLFYLTDVSRIDPETSAPRELAVQLWYPAAGLSDRPTILYADEAREGWKHLFQKDYPACTAEHLAGIDSIYTHAALDVAACTTKAPYPLIIFVHGYGMSRGNYSFFCEQIASQGYVVMMIIHSYMVEFMRQSDGSTRVCTMRPCSLQVLETGVSDIRYALDHLHEHRDMLSEGIINFGEIGIVGHSLGGSVAAQLCRCDERIKAAVSLDGPLFGRDATRPFGKPFLLMQSDEFDVVFDDEALIQDLTTMSKAEWQRQSEAFFVNNGDVTYRICVPGAEHRSFNDSAILTDIFRRIFANNDIYLNAGTVDKHACMNIFWELMTFLDSCLKHRGQMLYVANVEQSIDDFDPGNFCRGRHYL